MKILIFFLLILKIIEMSLKRMSSSYTEIFNEYEIKSIEIGK